MLEVGAQNRVPDIEQGPSSFCDALQREHFGQKHSIGGIQLDRGSDFEGTAAGHQNPSSGNALDARLGSRPGGLEHCEAQCGVD
jgi:hypothetical protein